MEETGYKPLIGITTYLEQAQSGVWDVRACFLPEVYIKAVTENGGIAVALPPQEIGQPEAQRILSSLDALIVAGGADINPELYGQLPGPHTETPRPDRDVFEFELTRAAYAMHVPFLGICRGSQMLNVALGGTLIQHLPDIVGDERYQAAPGQFALMSIHVEPGTKIAEVMGEDGRTDAHLYHHQAVDRLAEPLRVTSRSADGIVESTEAPDHPFCLGVQWHPEQNGADKRIFRGLIKAAREHHFAKTPVYK